MVQLWRLYRGGGMGGGHLPESGGVMDQAVHTMTCFAIMDGAQAMIDEERRQRGADSQEA